MYQRSIIKMFFVNVCTFGLYRLWWLIRTRNALVQDHGYRIPSVWVLLAPIIAMAIAFTTFVVTMLMSSGNGQEQATPVVSVVSFVLFYLIALAYLPLSLLWFWPYSKAVETYTNQSVSSVLALIAFLLIPDGIDILIIQDGFNKRLQSTPAPHVA